MASKINPKGVFKSNAKPKGPNPRGINKVSPAAKINPSGVGPNKSGINPGGIKKPIVKSSTPSNTNSTTMSSSSNRTSRPVKSGSKPVRAGAKPVRVGSTSPTNTSSTTSAPKTNTIAKAEPLSSKSANRTSRPVRSGSKPVRTGSKPVRTGSKQIKTGKGTSFKVGAKPVSGSTSVTPKSSFASKAGNVAGKVGKVAGKIAGKIGKAAVVYEVANTLIEAGKGPSQVSAADKKKYAEKKAKEKFSVGFKKPSEIDQIYNAVTGKYDKPKKSTGKSDAKKDTTNTGKPQVGGNRSAKTLIETPSLKDELKKRGVDTKPVKDKAKTNWLDTAKKGDTLKYVINKPKAETKKEDSKKGALPKAIDKAVRAIDGNQPGSGESLKFKGDKSKVAGKDKWGRSPSSKWYGFNPESKKYEAPTMVKDDNKKSDTKVETKKPATTPKVTTPKTTTPKASTPAVKKAEPVGTLAPKSTTETASKTLEEAKTVTPSKTTTPTASTTTSSTPVVKAQPRATFINKVRGSINESRERRAGRAASRGNEEKSERLKEKISATEKKMMMKKGGVVKSKTKKK